MKLPVKKSDGVIDLIEVASIYYLEAAEGDTIIRTARKKPYRSIQELAQAFLGNAHPRVAHTK